MDRYEYHYNGNTNSNAHITYHIVMNDREKVVLEVGVENRINQARPNDVKACGKFSINERMVRKINSGEVQLYVVKKNGNGYNVSEVGLANYSQISPASISISDVDSRFSYKYTSPADGTNLASGGSTASVYFDGVVSHDCPKQYQFNKSRISGGRNYTEWVVIPEIGVVQEKKGFNQRDAENNVLELTSINGIDLDRFLDDFCRKMEIDFISGKFYDGERATISSSSVDENWVDRERYQNNNTSTTTPSTTTTTTSTSTCNIYKDLDKGLFMDWSTGLPANRECGGNSYINGIKIGEVGPIVTRDNIDNTTTTPDVVTTTDPTPQTNYCNEQNRYGTHIVQRKETLYAIARRYGLSVQDLRRWNGLQSDVIHPCMKIQTVQPGQGTTGSPVVVTEKGNGSPVYHTVARNETVYGIAKKYGYTVDKLRKINGLTSNEVIYPGQHLRVSDCNCPQTNSTKDAIAYTDTQKNHPIAYDSQVPQEYGLTGGERLVAKGNETNVEYMDGRKRRFHVVKEDETLFTISKKYNIAIRELRNINDMEPNEVIIPFQRIYLDY